MKRLYFAATLALFFSLLGTSAHAQSNFSVYFGMGSATDSASKTTLNDCGMSGTDAGTCNFITGNPQAQPPLGGLFGMIGADYMFRRYLGFGAEDSFHFSQASYLGLGIRPSFFDFNAIFMPLPKSGRIVPEIQGGLGGTHLSFYAPTVCTVTCSNSLVQTSNHFQLHSAIGVRLYVTRNIFIRPQFDIHWVHNFVEYGSDWVPEYTVAVGYTFGGR